jgi:peptide/nickel transport system ATP-binding protein
VILLTLSEQQCSSYRGGAVAMIFQEPMSSLNPVYTCGFQMVEGIRQHRNVSKEAARNQAIALLQEVKLLPSDDELRASNSRPNTPLGPNQPFRPNFSTAQAGSSSTATPTSSRGGKFSG